MKKVILLFVLSLTFGSFAFAQSTTGNSNGIPTFEQEEQMFKERAQYYSQMMEYTEAQEEKATEIANKYIDIYKQNKSKYADIKSLRRYRKELLVQAINEMKPHLTAKQWEKVKEVAATRKIDLD
jgi:hypothetical protein